MPTSIIKVYDSKRGKWQSCAKVVLSWNGLANQGMSKPVYTDTHGIAEISHSSTGKAIVYVDGKTSGTVNTLGSTTITV